MFGTISETIELPVFFPPFSQFELCFLSLATKRFMLIEERNGSRTTWTLRQYEVGAVSTGGYSLSASAAWKTRDKELERKRCNSWRTGRAVSSPWVPQTSVRDGRWSKCRSCRECAVVMLSTILRSMAQNVAWCVVTDEQGWYTLANLHARLVPKMQAFSGKNSLLVQHSWLSKFYP